jgi:hypothetical protein
MTFWDFASGSPYLATFIAFLVIMLVRSIFKSILVAWNRWLRSRNIRAHGWPRAPIDADGDVIHPVTPEKVADAVIAKMREAREERRYQRFN